MQTDPSWQPQTLTRFMDTSRQYLGLMWAPVGDQTPQRPSIRTLLLAGSLGGVLGIPAYASEAARIPEDSVRNQSADIPCSDRPSAVRTKTASLTGRAR